SELLEPCRRCATHPPRRPLMAPAVSSPRDAAVRQARRLGLGGVGVAAVITVIYVVILANEGDALVNIYSAFLVAAEVLAGAGALTARRPLLAVGATLLSLLGLLGLASIGLPLLFAAGLLWAAVALLR
ncbi:MAG: hypothetical protein ACRDZ7_20860, partial [Acidimicrobiia bacterium]